MPSLKHNMFFLEIFRKKYGLVKAIRSPRPYPRHSVCCLKGFSCVRTFRGLKGCVKIIVITLYGSVDVLVRQDLRYFVVMADDGTPRTTVEL